MVEATPVRRLPAATLVLLGIALALVGCSPSNNGNNGNSADGISFASQPMTAERMGELILRIDDAAVQDGSSWYFNIDGLDAVLVYDLAADRMRVLIPVNDADDLSPEEIIRLMKANFDSALDARYAIAQGKLWGVFIHPLSSLTDEEFLLGIGQTANVVTSFGTSYSSGMFIFGGGDSEEIERNRLLQELREESI